ncbi:hypothetical protein J2T17_005186 [Paenibacillus mucilaginosus]|uniref:DUF4306 domain-containing protein n=1 Tax=Paenibacillus mucilaginosus TaxID=61624 RepID=UPI003D1BE589
MRPVWYMLQLAAAGITLFINLILALWQGGDLVRHRDWKEHAVFTPQGEDYPYLADRLLYAAKNYPMTPIVIVVCSVYTGCVLLAALRWLESERSREPAPSAWDSDAGHPWEDSWPGRP